MAELAGECCQTKASPAIELDVLARIVPRFDTEVGIQGQPGFVIALDENTRVRLSIGEVPIPNSQTEPQEKLDVRMLTGEEEQIEILCASAVVVRV